MRDAPLDAAIAPTRHNAPLAQPAIIWKASTALACNATLVVQLVPIQPLALLAPLDIFCLLVNAHSAPAHVSPASVSRPIAQAVAQDSYFRQAHAAPLVIQIARRALELRPHALLVPPTNTCSQTTTLAGTAQSE